jgi:hypothetical protein
MLRHAPALCSHSLQSPSPCLIVEANFTGLSAAQHLGREHAVTVIAAPALAALKEAVFQITMAQIDPLIGAGALWAARTRLAAATEKLALPTLTSLEAVRRLCNFGLLARGAGRRR